jgi:hypothetical protein
MKNVVALSLAGGDTGRFQMSECEAIVVFDPLGSWAVASAEVLLAISEEV